MPVLVHTTESIWVVRFRQMRKERMDKETLSFASIGAQVASPLGGMSKAARYWWWLFDDELEGRIACPTSKSCTHSQTSDVNKATPKILLLNAPSPFKGAWERGHKDTMRMVCSWCWWLKTVPAAHASRAHLAVPARRRMMMMLMSPWMCLHGIRVERESTTKIPPPARPLWVHCGLWSKFEAN
jgi:hypothetical protein